MKEQGAILSPSEPGVDWQRANAFPAQDLLRAVHQLQQRALKLEVDNRELQRGRSASEMSTEEFSRIYDSAPIGYVEVDEATTILRINKAGSQLLGATPQNLPGKTLVGFFAPADGERFRRHLKECDIDDKTHSGGEYGLQISEQQQKRVEVLCLPRDGHRGYRIALADVTEVTDIEQKILRLAAFPTYNPNPVLEFSPDGTLVWFNESALDMAKFLGVGSPMQIAPPHAAQIAAECFAARENRIRQETVIGDRHLYWSFFPIETSNVVHCYGTDLTERFQLETQLEHTRKLETVGQLASNVAHDFNNVLGIIQGYTCLLLSQPGQAAETAESLRQISAAAERATFLTRQLMTFSRKQAFQPKAFDLNELLNRMGPTMRGLLGQSIHQELKLGSNLPLLQGDPALLEQAVMNMAINARDAMPRGGTLAVSTSLVDVAPDAARRNPEARPGKHICLTISDTGQGMDRETVTKIFEPFFTTKENGLGLGLSSAYGIVRQHHGWVEVESKVGVGSVFRIYLPISPVVETAGKRQVPGAAKPAAGAETILVVEDEPALRELVSRQLRRRGYQIIQASTGKEALGLWSQHGPEIALLFTDMVMPDGMTGSELAETLQAQKPDLKVVYTSGYSEEVLQQDFGLRGEVHFLQKPYHQDALIKTIRAALESKAPVKG